MTTRTWLNNEGAKRSGTMRPHTRRLIVEASELESQRLCVMVRHDSRPLFAGGNWPQICRVKRTKEREIASLLVSPVRPLMVGFDAQLIIVMV